MRGFHRGVAQPGSALLSGRRGRGFKSRHPDIANQAKIGLNNSIGADFLFTSHSHPNGLDPLRNQIAFQFGHGPNDRKHGLAHRALGVDLILNADKADTEVVESLAYLTHHRTPNQNYPLQQNELSCLDERVRS